MPRDKPKPIRLRRCVQWQRDGCCDRGVACPFRHCDATTSETPATTPFPSTDTPKIRIFVRPRVTILPYHAWSMLYMEALNLHNELFFAWKWCVAPHVSLFLMALRTEHATVANALDEKMEDYVAKGVHAAEEESKSGYISFPEMACLFSDDQYKLDSLAKHILHMEDLLDVYYRVHVPEELHPPYLRPFMGQSNEVTDDWNDDSEDSSDHLYTSET